MPLYLWISDLVKWRVTSATILPSNTTPLIFSLLVSHCISQSGLKIDENLLWDYVLWAANNVEEPPGLLLPKQRCNKARSWKIHGYLMETEASEPLCYIHRSPFFLTFCNLYSYALPTHPSGTLEETWHRLLLVTTFSRPHACHKHKLCFCRQHWKNWCDCSRCDCCLSV